MVFNTFGTRTDHVFQNFSQMYKFQKNFDLKIIFVNYFSQNQLLLSDEHPKKVTTYAIKLQDYESRKGIGLIPFFSTKEVKLRTKGLK